MSYLAGPAVRHKDGRPEVSRTSEAGPHFAVPPGLPAQEHWLKLEKKTLAKAKEPAGEGQALTPANPLQKEQMKEFACRHELETIFLYSKGRRVLEVT